MKMIKIIMLIMLIASHAIAQADKTVESTIKEVTVFLSKAQVTREVKTKIEAGKTNLIIAGLTSQLDPQSIQITGKGNFIILGINHGQNYLNEFNKPLALKKLQDSVEIYKRMITIEQNQKDILNKEEQMLLSNQKIGGSQQNLTVNELKAMADFYRARLSEIGLGKLRIEEKVFKLNGRITKLSQQINEQNSLYGRNTSEIIVSLSAQASTSVDLDINYIVSNAGWHPIYDLRAVNTKSPIQLNYKANVFQNTGEEWKNVKLKLSTANPSLGGLKPDLYTWYLDFYQPTFRIEDKAMYKRKATMAPMAVYDAAGEAASAAPAETVADFVNTIQTTLNTEFVIALPYTVSTTNKPTTVDIRNYEMKAAYVYAVAPKLDGDAFLIGKAVGWEEFNLLPGEANLFFEGTFVGKSFIDPNNIKDTLSVSLGRDKRIVVKREKLKDYTSRKTIGINQRDSYAWEISVRNTKNEPIKIIVEDQVPVSQNSQIEVTMLDAGGAHYFRDTGKLMWEIECKPSETKKMVYKFEVKYPKDRVISNLN